MSRNLNAETLEPFWIPFQEYVKKHDTHDEIKKEIDGTKEFFEWFKNYDLSKSESDVWLYRDIYNILPYPVAKVLDEFYRLLGIKIHDHSPIRPETRSQK
jgi:hypothetical protein